MMGLELNMSYKYMENITQLMYVVPLWSFLYVLALCDLKKKKNVHPFFLYKCCFYSFGAD